MQLTWLLITKKIVLTDKGHYRFYSPNYHPEITGRLSRKKRPRAPKIYIPDHPEIDTEKKLAKLIYDNWGSGIYRVQAHAKGIGSSWTFWKGEINDRGFRFFKRDLFSKAQRNWKGELRNAEDEEEKNMISEFIRDDFEDSKKKKTRYGFLPFLKPSGRRGDLILWESLELPTQLDPMGNPIINEEKDWGEERLKERLEEKKKSIANSWGNGPIKKKEYAKW